MECHARDPRRTIMRNHIDCREFDQTAVHDGAPPT
jgi:hypothetical protein